MGFAASGSICSICGTDNTKSYCRHWPGKTYDKEGGQEVCTFKLTGVKDAYEFSLVAVPAQRAAGVSKSYTGETVYEKDHPEEPEKGTETPEGESQENTQANEEKAKELALRLRMSAKHIKPNI